ncbi:MAG: hypothetical protein LBO06_02435 [Bacteroidales bacterium]|jgi:hypothetical protein|nr:hypothetical protein [Bacteroidales bacterium]
MLEMNYKIQIGEFLVGMIDKVEIRKSIESLADIATITLPGVYINQALHIESKIKEGYAVKIQLGYNNDLITEFEGFVNVIKTDDNSIRIECEDDLYKFRKSLKDVELKNIKVNDLLTHIVNQIDGTMKIACNYDFTERS